MKKLASALCLIGVVVVGFVWLASTERGRAPVRPAEARPAVQRAPARAAVLRRAEPLVAAELPRVEGASAAARERPRVEPLAGLLKEHEPLPAALLTWTPLPAELEGVRYIHSIDFDRLRALSVSTACDADGKFAFPAVPEGAASGASVVWITRPGREACSVWLESGAAGWRWPALEVAPARAAVRVVVRRAGEPVAGASVRHTLSFWEPGHTEDEQRARRVFLREARTGADGAVEIVPGSGDNALLALEGAERSLLWIGTPRSEVELELLPTIEVAGTITSDDPALAFDGVRYNVGYFSAAERADLTLLQGSRGIGPDGRFGPDLWPRVAATQLWVLASGGEIVPAHATVLNPAPGASASVALTTTRGFPFELVVTEPAGEPLQGAAVRASHWNGSEWLTLRQELTGEDGRAALRAPRGALYVQVGKPGFTSLVVDDARTLVPRAEPLTVVLRPAGVIEGFVHHQSEPVKRFTLVAWNEDKSYFPQLALEDEEGAFRLADVPKGETVRLFAFSERLPQSVTEVLVLGDEPRALELELPAPCKVRGRVIDSLTREPVPAATIQHLTSGMTGLATYRGKPMSVQADGTFELDGFFPGRGGFACVAEGYETLFYSTREDEAESIDAGLLVLHPLSVLEVRVCEDGVSDFSAYQAWNRHNDDRTPVALNVDGTLAIPSRTGPYEVSVARADGSVAWLSGIVLPGEHRRVELDLSRGLELAVVLRERPPDVQGWSVNAFSNARDGERWTQARWSSASESFLLRGLGAGEVVLELRDAEGHLCAQRSAELADAGRQTITLGLDGAACRLRLVDGRGRPWASRPVVVSLGDTSGWYTLRETDAAGELEIGPLDARRVVLSAKLANESIAYGVAVELEPDPARTTEVVLDVGARSLLLLTEEGRPLGGVSVAYKHDRGPRYLEFGYSSEDSGLIRGPFLGPGLYTVRVNHARYWPTRMLVTGRDSADPLPFELYSRATLALTVTSATGEPAAGATLALEHAQLAQSADEWLAAGLLAPLTSLSSDASGRLVLGGVPRGTYSWTCAAPDGSHASGTLRLAPGERQELSVRLER